MSEDRLRLAESKLQAIRAILNAPDEPTLELLTQRVFDYLDLSVRAQNCLHRTHEEEWVERYNLNPIYTVGDLLTWRVRDLLIIKNCGMTTVNEIRTKLAEKRLSLRCDGLFTK